MRSFLFAVACLASLGRPAVAGEAARLAGFPGVDEVVVASAHPDLGEVRLRWLVETRLKGDGLLLEHPTRSGGHLSLRVSGSHHTSASGPTHTTYDVTLSVTEPASLERDPSIRLASVVWEGTRSVSTFSPELPVETVIFMTADLLTAFSAGVEAASPGK